MLRGEASNDVSKRGVGKIEEHFFVFFFRKLKFWKIGFYWFIFKVRNKSFVIETIKTMEGISI